MGQSTGIILTAGVITAGNDLAQGIPLAKMIRPAVAFLGTALIFAGLERLDQEAATGLAVIVMITVLIGGAGAAPNSPFREITSLIGKPAQPDRRNTRWIPTTQAV